MAVAPVAPAAGEVAVSLALFLLYVVTFGFLWTWRNTLGVLLRGLAHEVDALVLPLPWHRVRVLGPLADALRTLDGAVDGGLAAAALACERGAAWLWHLAANQLEQLGDAIGGLAYDVEQALAHALTVTVPGQLAAGRAYLSGRITAARLEAAAALAATTATLERAEHALGGRLGHLELDTARIGRILRRLESRTVGVGAAALVTAALARIGLGWVRCRNVSKAARRLCGMDYDLLESLLADTLLIAGTVSLVELAEGLLEVEDELVGAVAHGFRELRGKT